MRFHKFFEFKKQDLEPIKSFRLKDELNPKIWTDFTIDSEIREDLLKIGGDFFETVELKCDVKDIILCGSLCNYNWSEKYSDYDLHIIINYSDINDDVELVEKLCDYAKKQWNLQHDIKISNYEVEVSIQDTNDLRHAIKVGRMGGVYSLLNNKWIKKPEKIDFQIDEKDLKKKASFIMSIIDEIENSLDKDNYSEFKEKITTVWKKIKNLRQSGLEEDGELSTGNLLFKLLRRNGYVEKIMKLKKSSYDKQYESIKEWYDETILSFLYSLDKISERADNESYEGHCKFLNYTYEEDKSRIHMDFGYHGYSDGFSEEWIVDFSDIEYILVTTDESEEKYDSFNEIINVIEEII